MKPLLLTSVILVPACTTAVADKKPNIVYVIVDQMRADMTGYVGNTQAITPRIDAFAAESFNLNNAISVSPVSAPHRASLFTGKYTSSTGMVINEININLNQDFLAEVLNENGYNCGYVGKMHLNDQHKRSYVKGPERIGFDDYWAGYSFNHNSYKAFYYTDNEKGEEVHVDLADQYSPEVFTTLTCDYIERASKEDKPFAVVLSYNPPHDPWTEKNTDPECYAKFKDAKFDLPENFLDTPDPYMDRYNQQFFEGEEAWKDAFIKNGGYQKTMRAYYAMVNSMDEQFGRVLDKLDELGIADNTIVVFTSDHGEQFTSQGRMYKMTFYDESARVPYLVRYPKAIKPGASDVCFNTPDIFPTLLGLVGLEKKIPNEVEGQDLSFVLCGKKGKEPEFAFMQGMGHTYKWIDGIEWRAVRDKKFTYARYLRDGSEHLYDLNDDPLQMRNLAHDQAYERTLNAYRAKMASKMKGLNDEFKPCTWYQRWMYKGYSIKAAAKGEFKGDIPLTEPRRTE